MRPIIELHGLSKKYRLGRIGSTSIRDSIERGWNRHFAWFSLDPFITALQKYSPSARREPSTGCATMLICEKVPL